MPRMGVIALWMLTIGVMSAFGPEDEDQRVERWNEIIKTPPRMCLAWEDARAHLESVLWIRGIPDGMDEKVYSGRLRRDLPGS